MSEIASLSETLEKTIMDWCAANGGGFPMGFVCIVDLADEDGERELRICKPDSQTTHNSLGLASYLKLWFEDDAQRSWMVLVDCDDDEE